MSKIKSTKQFKEQVDALSAFERETYDYCAERTGF